MYGGVFYYEVLCSRPALGDHFLPIFLGLGVEVEVAARVAADRYLKKMCCVYECDARRAYVNPYWFAENRLPERNGHEAAGR